MHVTCVSPGQSPPTLVSCLLSKLLAVCLMASSLPGSTSAKNTFSLVFPQLETELKPSAVVSECGLVSRHKSCAKLHECSVVGLALGLPLGDTEGLWLGLVLGIFVGLALGETDGETDGELGLSLGEADGDADGLTLGDALGALQQAWNT